MANSVKGRDALVRAAKELLPDRAPSSVTGRELAKRAGVNYGLIHHYFGGKEAVFREALLELRVEFLATHEAHDLPDLLSEPENPYLRAVGRAQIDYPNEVGPGEDFPIGDAMVASLRERLASDDDVEAKARAIAMLCLQIGYSLYQPMLLDGFGVTKRQRPEVERVLGRLYREVSARR